MTPGGRFLGLILGAGGQMGTGLSPQVQVVLNWFEELKKVRSKKLEVLTSYGRDTRTALAGPDDRSAAAAAEARGRL